jgi:hypothetical protein
MSGGKLDIVPLITCVCGQPKYRTTLACVLKCPGAAKMAKIQDTYDQGCKNPQQAAEQLNGLVAKFSSFGAMGSKGKGSKGFGKGKGKGKFGKGAS